MGWTLPRLGSEDWPHVFLLVQVEATMKKYAFNRWASDKMSLKRQLPDVRHATCRTIEYDKDLPSVSGIVA